jgi:hypothetical protein
MMILNLEIKNTTQMCKHIIDNYLQLEDAKDALRADKYSRKEYNTVGFLNLGPWTILYSDPRGLWRPQLMRRKTAEKLLRDRVEKTGQ